MTLRGPQQMPQEAPVRKAGSLTSPCDPSTPDLAPPDLACGDCLDDLPRLVAARGAPFDHVIADPPYEDMHHARHGAGTITRTDGRRVPGAVGFAGIDALRNEAAGAMVAASRGWVIVFCLAEGVRPWHDALTDAGARWHGTAAWIKPDAAPMFAGTGPARGFECLAIAWAGTGRRRWNGGGTRGLFECPTAKTGFAGAKPLALMRALVALFTAPGDVICDPFLGSGTTGVAALEAGRGFAGIEIDPETFAQAEARIGAARHAPALPLEPKPRQIGMVLE